MEPPSPLNKQNPLSSFWQVPFSISLFHLFPISRFICAYLFWVLCHLFFLFLCLKSFFVLSVLSMLPKHFLFYLFPISLFIFAACFLRLVCQFSVWLSRTISLLLNGTKIKMRCEIYSILFLITEKLRNIKRAPVTFTKGHPTGFWELLTLLLPIPPFQKKKNKTFKRGIRYPNRRKKRPFIHNTLVHISYFDKSKRWENETFFLISFLSFLQTKSVYLLMH